MNRDEEQRWEEMNGGNRYQQFKARALSKPAVRKAYEEGLTTFASPSDWRNCGGNEG